MSGDLVSLAARYINFRANPEEHPGATPGNPRQMSNRGMMRCLLHRDLMPVKPRSVLACRAVRADCQSSPEIL